MEEANENFIKKIKQKNKWNKKVLNSLLIKESVGLYIRMEIRFQDIFNKQRREYKKMIYMIVKVLIPCYEKAKVIFLISLKYRQNINM
jgi:hypothetical protein